jgi:hypothetical protein
MDHLGFGSGGIHATTTTATDSPRLIVSPHDFALGTLRATIAAAFRFILYRNAFDHDSTSPVLRTLPGSLRLCREQRRMRLLTHFALQGSENNLIDFPVQYQFDSSIELS